MAAADQSSTPATDVVETPADDDVVEELLVEEVSIDGMCGVY
jgi:mycofactocin precursor